MLSKDRADVLVIGEALMDIVTSPQGIAEHPGGSPANVAFGLGRLGITTELLTSVANDARGAAIQAHLEGVRVQLVPGSTDAVRTPTATAILSADGSAHYKFDLFWDVSTQVANSASLPKVVHTGSIASFLAPGAEAVKGVLERARGQALVTYDPNIRPALLGSQADALRNLEGLLPFIDVVKLSDEDAAWLFPDGRSDTVIHWILERGAKLVAITEGAGGSILTAASGRVHVPSIRTAVVDTIGAGDSYMSGLIYGLLLHGHGEFSRSDLTDLGQLASTAAAITVSRPGADPPTEAEVRAQLERV